MLDRDEYVEQAHFFQRLSEREALGVSTQELLTALVEELLSTTNLPKAIDFLASELRHYGVFHTAMAKLPHYFSPFQTYVIGEAENDRSRFDMSTALVILAREATYRAQGATPQGLFLYEFEALSRNRLGYDRGLDAIAGDSLFDEHWKRWIALVRQQVGLVDFADLIYVRSEYYLRRQLGTDSEVDVAVWPVLFGEGEGRIALANRGKDPLLLFNALHRHLGYPEVPRPPRAEESPQLLPLLLKRVDRLEARTKLIEEELKGGIDLTRFYGEAGRAPEPPASSG